MSQLMCFLCFIFLLTFSANLSAKKRCKPLLEKLHNVQAMQRKAYSGSRGASLRAKEDKARDHWWQCEQGRSKKKKANKKTKKSAYSHMKGAQVKSSKANKITAGIPFKNSQVIVVNSKYQGKKKQAWHQYYQQPRKCQRPQSLSEFAFCSENKQTQRIDFEQQYRQSKPLF